jgi:hypothetical protein
MDPGCGKTARPVRREGEPPRLSLPYQEIEHLFARGS